MTIDRPRATAGCVRFILQKRVSLRSQDWIPWILDHASPSLRSTITNMDAQKTWWDFRILSQATLRLITVCFVSSIFLYFIHSISAWFGYLTIHYQEHKQVTHHNCSICQEHCHIESTACFRCHRCQVTTGRIQYLRRSWIQVNSSGQWEKRC